MNSDDLKKALKKHFGFSAFKGLQESVIAHLLKQENSFVIMPTGGGKSLCYQLPALMQEGTAIGITINCFNGKSGGCDSWDFL